MILKESYRSYQNVADSWFAINNRTISLNEIDDLSSKFLRGENFTIARYNDGEWIIGLKIPPFFGQKQKMRLQTTSNEDWVKIVKTGNQLIEIIKQSPQYYISVDAFSLSNPTLKSYILPFFDNLNLTLGGGIFNIWSFYTGFADLFSEFNRRHVILVGPKYLKSLPFDIKQHIETHPTLDVTDPYLTLEKIIKYCELVQDKNIVIVYSCSFTAKIAIHKLYSIYNNSITQLDFGASLMPFSKRCNRPWHKTMINEIKKLNLYS